MKTPKLDLTKIHRDEYSARRQPAIVATKPAQYLAISGTGRPGDELFQSQIGALYAVAFTIKMRRKFAGLQDYAVGKLEAQWPTLPNSPAGPKSLWRWRLLIRSPDFLTDSDLESAKKVLREKGHSAPIADVTLASIDEGSCVQALHVGPYDREPETVAEMQAFAAARGLTCSDQPHEIYLSDPRRVPPDRLKTILRLPVKKAA